MGATRIMVIRHAEKPGSYNGTQYFGVNPTGDIAGKDGSKHLITTGWQRAGALVTLFALPWGPKPGLDTPAYLFASNPEPDSSSDTDDARPSQRPYETLTPLAAKLGLTIDIRDKKSHYDKMVTKALDRDGAVLIAWQHEDIPLLTKDGQPGISQSILTQTQTSAGNVQHPENLAERTAGSPLRSGVRVPDRPAGKGPIENFSLIAQILLAGDYAAPGLTRQVGAHETPLVPRLTSLGRPNSSAKFPFSNITTPKRQFVKLALAVPRPLHPAHKSSIGLAFAAAKGFIRRRPSIIRPSCISSVSSTLAPACADAAHTTPSHSCMRCSARQFGRLVDNRVSRWRRQEHGLVEQRLPSASSSEAGIRR